MGGFNLSGQGAGQLSMMLQGGSALSGMAGSYYSAQALKQNLHAKARIADINAQIAERGAQSAIQQGQRQIGRQTRYAGQVQSHQRAAQAASGVDLGVGSAAEVRASTDILSEQDRNQLELNALYNAWGYRTQATNYENAAEMAGANAEGISPVGAMVPSLLSGAGRVADHWYLYSTRQRGT